MQAAAQAAVEVAAAPPGAQVPNPLRSLPTSGRGSVASSTVGTVNTGESGIYGTQGTAAAGNVPGGRGGSGTWTDTDGNFWLFGGQGQDSAGVNGFLNDMWEFNTSTKQWTWVAGSQRIGPPNGGKPGIYGTLGAAAITNMPGGRAGENELTDKSGNFWLYGGNGYDGADILGYLNDLWEYNPKTKQWTWLSGSNSVGVTNGGQPGVYGTQGVAAAINVPGGRSAQASWFDGDGNYWIFGGIGFDSVGTFGFLNDLWEFSPTTKMWTCIGGSTIVGVTYGGPSGVYGTLGTAAPSNIPGGRSPAANWTDTSGNFWIFGGVAIDSKGTIGSLNDLWKFDITSKQWIWWGGSDVISHPYRGPSGVYGTLETASTTNVPGGRSGSVGWTDNLGNFWLFGGEGFDSVGIDGYLNDLWKFDPVAKTWTWMGGSKVETIPTTGGAANPYVSGVYGTLGTPAATNVPGSRFAASIYTDSSGNLWMFGGYGNDSTGTAGNLNDLWRYTP